MDVLEAQAVQQVIMDLILGHDPDRSRVWLPGSQPVSLDSTNLQLLRELKYWWAQGATVPSRLHSQRCGTCLWLPAVRCHKPSPAAVKARRLLPACMVGLA